MDPKNPSGTSGTSDEKRTLVEEGTRFKGSLSSTCPIVVQGSVEGDVEGPSVKVSATGSISGKIATGTLDSAGKIAGDFDVDSARLEGSVEKDTVIRAASLDLKLAVDTGKLQLTFGPAGRDGSRGRS
jgi:hypothetical protein